MKKSIKNQLLHHISPKNANPVFIVVFIALTLLGGLYVNYIWETSVREREEQAISLAKAAESGFQKSIILALDVKESDILRPEYKEIKSSLMLLANQKNDIRFAYIYVQRDNKIYFLADSEPEGSPDCSPPGQEYWEAEEDQSIFLPYETGDIIVTEPTPDRWGNWVSVLVPMREPLTGEIVAVFGVDYPAEIWNEHAVTHAIMAAVTVFFGLLILISLYLAYNQYVELRRERSLFKTIFEQAPIGIAIGHKGKFIVNSQEKRPSVNAMYMKITGRSEEELSALTWEDITHPEDFQMEDELINKLFAGEIKKYDIDKRYVLPDNSSVWVHLINTRLRFKHDLNSQYLCLVEDISWRRQMEEALFESERAKSILLENLPGMAYRCRYDRQWTMEYVSQGCLELTGYPPESLLLNREISYNDLIVEKYREHIWNKWNQVVNNRSMLKEEYEIRTKSGEIKWVYEQGQAVFDNEGKVLALEGLIIDISGQKIREKEIQYLINHDNMTGLYNRRYFDGEMHRMEENSLPLSLIIGDINGVRLINDAFGLEEGDSVIMVAARLLTGAIRKQDVLARTGGDEFCILLPDTDNKAAFDVMKSIMDAFDEFNRRELKPYILSISMGCSTKASEIITMDQVLKEARDHMYKSKLLERKSAHGSIVTTIMASLFAKSQETENHADRISLLSRKIGARMGLDHYQLDLLDLFAKLHDVGKIGIDDSILNKPGELNQEEWDEMKKHPDIGYRIAMSTPELEPIAEYILTHHERWDGTGYPQGLKGEEIPLLSRILALVDAFDAMTEDRIYRRAISKEAAKEEIRRNAGSQFDPEIVSILLGII